jgi:hypothetical protein
MCENCISVSQFICLYLGDDDASINMEVGFLLTCICSNDVRTIFICSMDRLQVYLWNSPLWIGRDYHCKVLCQEHEISLALAIRSAIISEVIIIAMQ